MTVPELGRTLGEELLEPTRIYALDCLALARDLGGPAHAMAHVTGGGFAANLARVVPAGLEVVLDRSTWAPPPVFGLVGALGRGAAPRSSSGRSTWASGWPPSWLRRRRTARVGAAAAGGASRRGSVGRVADGDARGAAGGLAPGLTGRAARGVAQRRRPRRRSSSSSSTSSYAA